MYRTINKNWAITSNNGKSIKMIQVDQACKATGNYCCLPLKGGVSCKLSHQAGSDSQVGPQSSHSVGMNSRTFTVLRTSRLFSKQKMPAVIQVNICAMICACHPAHLT